VHDWASAVSLEATDEHGRSVSAEGVAGSHMVLPHATAVCVNSTMTWTVDGAGLDRARVDGEDQDVWPIPEWRARRLAKRTAALG
jgi:hypothetical protein